MKALLICPADRPAVAALAEATPLALTPLLGKSLLEYWLEALVARGVRHVLVLACDRPDQIRRVVGDGTQWGLRLDLLPQARELSAAEARAKFRSGADTNWLAGDDVIIMETLPGQPDLPLFESYAGWFAAVQAWMPHAVTPARIGMHEREPGVWVGMHAQIAPTAKLIAPCWIGEHALVGPGAVIGPGAILDRCVVVERDARIAQSIVDPETFIGALISLERSLAGGNSVVNWQTGSCLRVPDAFLLCSLAGRQFERQASPLPARALALLAMVPTAPVAFVVMVLALLRGESPLRLRLGVRPRRGTRSAALDTFAYYELVGGANWLRRWPQFWSVARGDLAWFGNRPLRPTQALTLTNDFERLWLAAPAGLISLADAQGAPERVCPETCAHASYYAVNASARLRWFILHRSLVRASGAVPVWWGRKKEHAVPLPQFLPKEET
jgi:hypothetical protein